MLTLRAHRFSHQMQQKKGGAKAAGFGGVQQIAGAEDRGSYKDFSSNVARCEGVGRTLGPFAVSGPNKSVRPFPNCQAFPMPYFLSAQMLDNRMD